MLIHENTRKKIADLGLKKYVVFGRGTVVVKSCRQQFDRLMRTAQLFGVRECKFPAAANS